MNLSNDSYTLSDGQAKIAKDVDSWLSLALGRLHQLRFYWGERRAHAQEMRELHRFSDRELWDVGLSRSDILAIEQKTYRRE